MALNVRGQRRLLGEPFVAKFAREGSLARVRSFVHHQVLLHAERLAAVIAHVRFLAGMYPRVYGHVGLVHGFAANIARHEILPSVTPRVFSHIRSVVADEIALVALEQLPRVWIGMAQFRV